MLFNSYAFILGFVPIAFLVFFAVGSRVSRRAAMGWLCLCSLFFYGWWKPVYLALLLFSIGFNFFTGQAAAGRFTAGDRVRKAVLAAGITVNLGLLGYFKYANFFVGQVDALAGVSLTLTPMVLPLAISFFTFQQIAYLVDAYRGLAREYHFIDYCLFVSFFPQLIAGPIVHHGEMMPQFASSTRRFNAADFSVGLSYFIMGLFKKVVLADTLARFATPVFSAAEAGGVPTLFEAWGGLLAYTFQIYFDFSGYSDMAVGLGWMIGIRIPVNFNSPYKAAGIIDFWRRWHMTLSRFLRDYLYIPLGGNRRSTVRVFVNIMITMLLGGLWHGAGWTFVLWGGLHGLYLVTNHAWHTWRTHCGKQGRCLAARAVGRALTFLAVVCGWVLFRADSLPSAVSLYQGLAGFNGVSVSDNLAGTLAFLQGWGLAFDDMGSFESDGLKWIALGMLICWLLPNTQQFMQRQEWTERSGLCRRIPVWKPGRTWAAIMAALAIASLLRLQEVSEFLYFQF
jgi:alginate O-acetyltransferase complex protein AlgI